MDDAPLKVFGFHDGHACAYYRMLLHLDAMSSAGHEITTCCGWNEEARDYPVIVAQRVGKSDTMALWRRLRAGHKLVYETDDNMWAVDPTNMAAYMTHDAVAIDAINQCLQASHAVIVSTEPLAEVVRRQHDNVTVIPNFIDGELLNIERVKRDRLVVGWAGGDSHLRDISLITSELRRFLKRNPKVEFHNLGSDYTKVLGIPGRATGWHSSVWEYYRAIDFDIGLAPLASTVFNRSKSHIKALEYAALGIPVIASDEPPYHDFVLDGVTGFLVKSEHEWGRRLWTLINDQAMREEMGAKAKQHAANFTIQRHWHLWENLYRGL